MSNIDASDETKNPPQEKTQIIFFYPFKTTGGEYRAYHMNFEYSTKNINFATTIRSLIESIELPGVSPFSD